MKINEEKLEKLKLDYVYSFYLDEHQKNLVKAAYEAGYRAFPNGPEMRNVNVRADNLAEVIKHAITIGHLGGGSTLRWAEQALKEWEENE